MPFPPIVGLEHRARRWTEAESGDDGTHVIPDRIAGRLKGADVVVDVLEPERGVDDRAADTRDARR
jgi:hypothetical protein